MWAIRELKRLGHTIILWTCRGGEKLEAALRWLDMLGVPYDYANENDPAQNELFGNDSRKVGAFRYVDDKNAGRWSWREIIEEARAMKCPDCGGVMQKGMSGYWKCPRCGYCSTEGGEMVESGREVIAGVGPEAPTVTNERGGKQSATPYRFDLIPPKTLLGIAGVFGHGAAKYGEHNWRKLSIEELLCHVVQHIEAWRAGDRQDDHLLHAACRIVMAAAQELEPTEDTPQ